MHTTLVTLDRVPPEEVLATFNAAFADYIVPATLDETRFARIAARRGYRPDLSVGAREGERLVGVSLTGFGEWDGLVTGYGSGTGVIPEARNRGLAGWMILRASALAAEAGADRYVLEVIRENEPARRAYERSGFRTTRELLCWTLDAPRMKKGRAFRVETTEGFAPAPPGLASWRPSWQNSDESLARAIEPLLTLRVQDRDHVAGFAVVSPETGDLAQFAVEPALRRRGIGRALLAAARAASAFPLRIVNTDAASEETTAFLRAIGAESSVSQFEMVLEPIDPQADGEPG